VSGLLPSRVHVVNGSADGDGDPSSDQRAGREHRGQQEEQDHAILAVFWFGAGMFLWAMLEYG
jgi:hypothetical protein